MKWSGNKLKVIIGEKVSVKKLADTIGVSRQSINDWINGKTPNGKHLVSLCKVSETDPSFFFTEDTEQSIRLPAHQVRRNAKVTSDSQQMAIDLAKTYKILFANSPNSDVLPVVRVNKLDSDSAETIANIFRKKIGISDESPMDYKYTFNLLNVLGIKVIFRDFPEKLKVYAFYTKIKGHRVVFVNNSTNIIDLIFPLLHEAVHAVRDDVSDGTADFSEEEEKFCDAVANYSQFPDNYVKMVYNTIQNRTKGSQVNNLKEFARKNYHSLFGISKRIRDIKPNFQIDLGGADTNLKKEFSAIGELLLKDGKPDTYIRNLTNLSPLFMKIIQEQIESITNQKLAELFGSISVLDAKAIKDEIIKQKDTML